MIVLKPLRFDPEQIATVFASLHLCTRDLPPGYWERELRRQISRRSVRSRLRRAIYRLSGRMRIAA